MDTNFQPRRRARYRGDSGVLRIVPVPPAVVYATVGHVGGERFCWTFDAPYDDGGSGGWVAADFAGLRVGGLVPVGIDEVIGVDGTLTLVYDVQDPDAPDIQYEVSAAPAALRFDDDQPLAVPQNGFVTP
jgi:hypothetical protein